MGNQTAPTGAHLYQPLKVLLRNENNRFPQDCRRAFEVSKTSCERGCRQAFSECFVELQPPERSLIDNWET